MGETRDARVRDNPRPRRDEKRTGVAVEMIDSRSVTLKENGQSKVYRLRW